MLVTATDHAAQISNGQPGQNWELARTNALLKRDPGRWSDHEDSRRFIPPGQILPAWVYRRSVTDVLGGYALLWNLRKV